MVRVAAAVGEEGSAVVAVLPAGAEVTLPCSRLRTWYGVAPGEYRLATSEALETVLATLESLNRDVAILRIPPLPLAGDKAPEGLDRHPAICAKRKAKPRPKQLLSKGFTRRGNSTGVWDVDSE